MERNRNGNLRLIGQQPGRELARKHGSDRLGQDFASRVLQAQHDLAMDFVVWTKSHDAIERKCFG
jgi:hypothetical protein